MKLSEKNKQRLYDACANEIIDLRVKLKMDSQVNIDHELFLLEQRIWRNTKEVLNIKE